MQKKTQAASGIDSREIVGRYVGKPGALLGILEEFQEKDQYRHLSEDTMREIAALTGEPLSRVYSVATFYTYFNLKPQGKHTITVCRGTACHTRGSLALLEEMAATFNHPDFREEEESSFTTDDCSFTVRTVACFGQCALSPVVAIDGVIHSRLTPASLLALVRSIRKKV
jgi:NADH-quinone oxidoreductase subunit E